MMRVSSAILFFVLRVASAVVVLPRQTPPKVPFPEDAISTLGALPPYPPATITIYLPTTVTELPATFATPFVTESPNPLRVTTEWYQSILTIGWTDAGAVPELGRGWTATWQPMIYNVTSAYWTADRFFDVCAHYDATNPTRYPDDFATWCTPTYTACAAGWIEGSTSAFKCASTGRFHTRACATDLLYAFYGASNPHSRIRCLEETETPATIYLESPIATDMYLSQTPTITPFIQSDPDLDNARHAKQQIKVVAGSLAGVGALLVAIAVGFAVHYRRQAAAEGKKAKAAQDAMGDDLSLRSLGSGGVNADVPGGNVAVNDAEPPPYRP